VSAIDRAVRALAAELRDFDRPGAMGRLGARKSGSLSRLRWRLLHKGRSHDPTLLALHRPDGRANHVGGTALARRGGKAPLGNTQDTKSVDSWSVLQAQRDLERPRSV
jgi:hypothetical protein